MKKKAKKVEYWQLQQRQGLPLNVKILLSEIRIREFYNHFNGKVYVAFSGGKDSTILLHMVRKLYPDVPAVFCDTGLEYPEIRDFVKTVDNVTWIRPLLTYKEVIEYFGYPVISKQISMMIRTLRDRRKENEATRNRYLYGSGKSSGWKLPNKWRNLVDAPFKMSEECCHHLKIEPMLRYMRETKRYPYVGTLAADSMLRTQGYLTGGCNVIQDKKHHKDSKSRPLGFWTQNDIWKYIKTKDIPYCDIYDKGVGTTGCIFCMFGIHLEKYPNRFQALKKLHPKLYDYCINKLNCKQVLDYLNIFYE